MTTATHPAVAAIKFRREVENLRREGDRYRSLGVFLLDAAEPTVLVGFAAPHIKPSPLIVGMRADYTDYDLQAPSVRFVDPFTGEPYTAAQMPTMLPRAVEQPVPPGFPAMLAGLGATPPGPAVDGLAGDGAAGNGQAEGSPQVPGSPPRMMMRGAQPLLQAYGPDDVPFLCVAGVREYHAHPGHSGDSWELHRTTGAGSLTRLVEVVRTYAVQPVAGYHVELVPRVAIDFGQPPL